MENKKELPRILVIDDEHEFLELLQVILENQGFDVVTTTDPLAGLRLAYQARPDLILLDVMMPDVDGFEVCRRLRDITEVPIIFVTAKSALEDIVHGLSLGADDYVIKPFAQAELISRIRANLRTESEATKPSGDVLFPAESMILDCGRRELTIGSRKVYLRPKEFEVLRLLVHHAGKVLSTDAILLQVWGAARLGEVHLVKQYVYRLRYKIESDPDAPRYIKTARNYGYYFDAEDLL
ncbi:MAG: response regulator transcription factor [Anaerolineae bacterium]|nr:response regulator transcription factor [Anaerolineae bacterium]